VHDNTVFNTRAARTRLSEARTRLGDSERIPHGPPSDHSESASSAAGEQVPNVRIRRRHHCYRIIIWVVVCRVYWLRACMAGLFEARSDEPPRLTVCVLARYSVCSWNGCLVNLVSFHRSGVRKP